MRFLIGALAPLALLLTSPVWGQDYLYQARPVAQGEQPPSADGVLVREVLVKKGDTLSHLSKRFSGRGTYYPQILLFNSIKNPHLIYPGNLLRVPVSSRQAAQPATIAKPLAVPAPVRQDKPVPAVGTQQAVTAAPSKPASAEQASYARAQAAFKRGDCTSAVAQFDRFMAEFPQSSLLPDASLSRAECYLKLSAK
ncbi:MAG: LysM peptidoglycan-binding domain-containing protein [Trichlorobacter sp.]